MDYIKWSQEYIDEAQKILKAIDSKKRKLKNATADELHTLNSDIIRLKNIYYECMLTSKHLLERAGVIENAA